MIPTIEGSGDEYILYCSCNGRTVPCRWKSNEVMLCYVLKAAYERGYGTGREIIPVDPRLRERWPVEVGKYLSQWRYPRKNSA